MKRFAALGALWFVLLLVCGCEVADGAPPGSGDVASGTDLGAPPDTAATADTAPAPDAAPDAAPDDPPDYDPVVPDWPLPDCEAVQGPAPVTFSRDEGRTWAAIEGAPLPYGETLALAAFPGEPGALVAERAGTIYVSRDAGCSWAALGELPAGGDGYEEGGSVRFSHAAGRQVLAWVESDYRAFLVTPDGIEAVPELGLDGAPMGMALRPGLPPALRAVDEYGTLAGSRDGGATWETLGEAWPANEWPPVVWQAAFAPGDWNRVVIAAHGAARATLDGGATWHDATGFLSPGADPDRDLNVVVVAAAPSDPAVFWYAALTDAEDGVFRSDDGGRTVRRAASIGAPWNASPGFVPHPTDATRLFLAYPDTLYRIAADAGAPDAAVDTTELRFTAAQIPSNEPFGDESAAFVSSLRFSPAGPQVLYAGLGEEGWME